jgi:hypothetical protein
MFNVDCISIICRIQCSINIGYVVCTCRNNATFQQSNIYICLYNHFSVLTHELFDLPFQNLEDIDRLDYQLVLKGGGHIYGSFLHALPGTIEHRMMAKVKKEHIVSNNEDCLDTLLNIQPHGVFIYSKRNIRPLLDDPKYCSIVELPSAYKPITISIALAKDSEFSDLFRFFILKAIENGLIDEWLKDIFPEPIGDIYKNRCSVDKTLHFGYGKLITPFTALCTGTVISILLGFVERLYAICRKNQ